MKRRFVSILVVFIILAIGFSNIYADDYYPTGNWRTSTPEAQGMDSGMLIKMLDDIRIKGSEIHSILIIRHGYLVEEVYFHPFHRDFRHHLYSTTKSFTSSLIAIAMREGLIKSLDQKVLDFFPESQAYTIDPRKKELTIRHLLTMTGGLEEENLSDLNNSVYEISFSTDWLRFALELPLVSKAGQYFSYNSINSHILSAIIQKVSGMKSSEFAEKYLFGPIGITNYGWSTDSQMINVGGWGLSLTPSDMARLGYLYLKQGKWNNRQIIPVDYLEKATSAQESFTNLWNSTYGYGYQFWIDSFGGYSTRGRHGQYIITMPEQDMVVVFTGGLWDTWDPLHGSTVSLNLVRKYIIPSIMDNSTIPENPGALAALREIAKKSEFPDPVVQKLPKTAKLISGKKIQINQIMNRPFPSKLNYMTLIFNDSGECKVVEDWAQPYFYKAGLNGLFLKNSAFGELFSRGKWLDENTFSLENIETRFACVKTEWLFTFKKNEVTVLYKDESQRIYQEVKGKY